MTERIIDRLRDAADDERVGQAVLDALAKLSDVREWAEALTTLAEEIEMAVTAVQDYVDAKGREDKAVAKDEAVSALQNLVQTWNDAVALPAVEGLVAPP